MAQSKLQHLAARGAEIRRADKDVGEALRAALAEIDRQLGASPAQWKLWHLACLRPQIAAALGAGSEAMSSSVKDALWRASQLGSRQLRMAPSIASDLLAQLGRLMRLRIADVDAAAASVIGQQLAHVVLGVQTPFEATRAIHHVLGGGSAAMRRAEYIVTTEVAHAHDLAQKATMARAAQASAGLAKQRQLIPTTTRRPPSGRDL